MQSNGRPFKSRVSVQYAGHLNTAPKDYIIFTLLASGNSLLKGLPTLLELAPHIVSG
jgi:hypothetical protein